MESIKNGSVAKIDFDPNLLIRNGLVEPFNNLKVVDFGVFATELSAVMCLKVSRLFGSTPEFWMRLQAAYDLKKAEQDKKVMQRVARIVPLKQVEEVRAF